MRTAHRFTRTSAVVAVGLAAGLLAGAAPGARAQTDPRWDAWIGCWAPTTAKQLQQGAGANALLRQGYGGQASRTGIHPVHRLGVGASQHLHGIARCG